MESSDIYRSGYHSISYLPPPSHCAMQFQEWLELLEILRADFCVDIPVLFYSDLIKALSVKLFREKLLP